MCIKGTPHLQQDTAIWFVFPVVNGPSTAESKELHTVSVKLFEKAEYPNVQVKLTGSTRAAVPLTCPTHNTLPLWCLSYVLTRQQLGNNYQLLTSIFIPYLNLFGSTLPKNSERWLITNTAFMKVPERKCWKNLSHQYSCQGG